MKTDNLLEEKLKNAEANLPGVRDKLKPFGGASWGMHWKSAPEDIKYLETDKYQIVAAKWEQHEWSEYGGRVGWIDWVSLYYQEKGCKEEIREIGTKGFVTRDRESPDKDRRDLWPYHFVEVQPLGQTQVEVAWVDESGNKGPKYKLDLK